jgi:hypothetical protein
MHTTCTACNGAEGDNFGTDNEIDAVMSSIAVCGPSTYSTNATFPGRPNDAPQLRRAAFTACSSWFARL